MLDLTFNQGARAGTATAAPAAQVTPVAPTMPQAFPPVPAAIQSSGRALQPVLSAEDDQRVKYLALLMVVVAAGAGLIASFLVAQNVGAAERESAAYAALEQQLKTGEVAAALTHVQSIDRQLAVLTQTMKREEPWSEVLTVFSSLVPGSITLSSSSFAGTDVRVEGEGRTYDDVATFMASLEKSERFQDVKLVGSALRESADGSTVTFSLSGTYVPRIGQAGGTQ
ncbi:MAG: PilN domain-containing protein [Patescibacteria group bacterium]